jgi:hypothetical protein
VNNTGTIVKMTAGTELDRDHQPVEHLRHKAIMTLQQSVSRIAGGASFFFGEGSYVHSTGQMACEQIVRLEVLVQEEDALQKVLAAIGEFRKALNQESVLVTFEKVQFAFIGELGLDKGKERR